MPTNIGGSVYEIDGENRAISKEGVCVLVVEDGVPVELQPIPTNSYILLTGEHCELTHTQRYPSTGTVQLTIKEKKANSNEEAQPCT